MTFGASTAMGRRPGLGKGLLPENADGCQWGASPIGIMRRALEPTSHEETLNRSKVS